MDFGSCAAVEVIAFADIWTCSDLRICASDAHQTSISDTLNGGIQERNDWSIRIEVDNIKLNVFFAVNQHHIGVLQGLLVLGGIELVQLEVVFHEFVRGRTEVISVYNFDSFKFFNEPDGSQSTGGKRVNDVGSVKFFLFFE